MPKYTSKKTILPRLTDSMIENQAQADLIAFQKAKTGSSPFPIFPEELAQTLWGTQIIYEDSVVDVEGQEVLAAFVPEENKILFNMGLAKNDGQSSFTLAHEVGHVSLHNFLSKLGSTEEQLCRGSNMDTEKEAKRIENQADKYASFLLMPRIRLMEKMAHLGYRTGDRVEIDKIAKGLQEHFRVSRHALENKLNELGFNLGGAAYKPISRYIPESAYTSDEERARWDF